MVKRFANTLPPLLPRDLLFGNPERAAPKLSPDGTLLAYLAPKEGVINIWVRTLGEEDDRPVTGDILRPVRIFEWAEDGRHLLYLQDTGGDENFHVFSADVVTGKARDLTPFPGVRAMLLGKSHRFPETVVISHNKRDPHIMDAFRCDLTNGELTLVASNPGNVISWVADPDLQVRAALASTPDAGTELWVRETEEDAWKTLITFPFGEEARLVGFTADGKSLYLITDQDVNTQRLYQVNCTTGEKTLVHAREDVDLSSIMIHPTSRKVQAVGYNRARHEWIALEPEVAEDLAFLKTISDGDGSMVSRDRVDQTWVVVYSHDDAPTRWYLYERATRVLTLLCTDRPALEEAPLAKMTPVDIPTRDGLIMPCYLTLPLGVAPEKLPLVLAVHGGPWARDYWGFSPEVQWLANRGYAVLNINYRGSTGFGKAYMNAGNREWAAKMHDDLLDAVQWAVEQGYADPDCVAIYGGSYGGYAALVGLTFTPEVFACGVAVVGPSSLITLLNSIPPYWAPLKADFVRRVGDPDTEPEFLLSRSPLTYADRIARPLLVAQGANDPRVKKAESDQIVAAARKSGKDVTYLLFEDEGHGFARPENRKKFYAATEAFLARHLGGRAEPAHPGEDPPLVSEDLLLVTD